MIFLDLKKEYKKAKKEKYALGAFNTYDLEITQAICSAASLNRAKVIIQTTPKAIEYAGLSQIFDIVKNEILARDILAAIHLDHSRDFGIVKKCIDIGYHSVMIDGSKLDFESNIHLTKKVVNYAHKYGATVEGELGVLGKSEDGKLSQQAVFTEPDKVPKFVEKSGIDALAVSCGNEHGGPKGEKLDLTLLAKIAYKTDIPLVIHGSSGLSKNDIKAAINLGVVKFNIDTKIKRVFQRAIAISAKKESDPREILASGRQKIEELVSDYIKIFANV